MVRLRLEIASMKMNANLEVIVVAEKEKHS